MAGVSIELKKLLSKKGFLNYLSAYSYSGFIMSGPLIYMIAVLQFSALFLKYNGYDENARAFFTATIVNAGMLSIVIMNVLNMLLTRYIADMIYEKRYGRILTSMYGGLCLMLPVGAVICVIWLSRADVPLLYKVLTGSVVGGFIVVWTQMTYVSVLKDYKSMFLSYILSLASIVALSFLFVYVCRFEIYTSLLAAIYIGFGTMAVFLTKVLHTYYPKGKGSLFHFLRYIDRHPNLIVISSFWMIGAMIHQVIIWLGPYGIVEKNAFYYSPIYDWPAFCAYITVLPTLINFVVFVESDFYEYYKEYFDLIIGKGIFSEIEAARKRMVVMIFKRIFNMAITQLFITAILVIAGAKLFPVMTVGMYGIFRVLCISYFFYILANCILILVLYFDDQKSCAITSSIFFALCTLLTAYTGFRLNIVYYGVSFLIASLVALVIIIFYLKEYLKVVNFRVFCSQPIFNIKVRGIFTRISDYFENKTKSPDNGDDFMSEGMTVNEKI